MFLVLWAVRRSRQAAFVPLIPIALATGWSAGVLFILGMLPGPLEVDLNPMSVTLGALVIAISTEFSVLLSSRYRQEREKGAGPERALALTYGSTGAAVLASGATAIAGFAVLILSDITMLRDFGIVTVVDLGVSLIGVLLVLPAALLWAEEHGPITWRDFNPRRLARELWAGAAPGRGSRGAACAGPRSACRACAGGADPVPDDDPSRTSVRGRARRPARRPSATSWPSATGSTPRCRRGRPPPARPANKYAWAVGILLFMGIVALYLTTARPNEGAAIKGPRKGTPAARLRRPAGQRQPERRRQRLPAHPVPRGGGQDPRLRRAQRPGSQLVQAARGAGGAHLRRDPGNRLRAPGGPRGAHAPRVPGRGLRRGAQRPGEGRGGEDRPPPAAGRCRWAWTATAR